MSDKQVITEEMHVHDAWYEQARRMTVGDLPEFVRHLTQDYQHDYGTICHAVAAAAVAAAWSVDHSPTGGITGFQAGCIFWAFYEHWLHEKGPARLLKYGDMLYPQYWDEFTNRTISASTWKWLQEQAEKLLREHGDKDADGAVLRHWRSIRDGDVPFGYSVKP